MAAQPMIIDTDPATGYRFKDIDDGLAILYLLGLADDFDVLGLTVTHGNTSQEKAFEKACEVLDVAGRGDIPVLGGAVSRKDLGTRTASSDFLVEAASEMPGEITLLALGPLTNAATAGELDVRFFGNLKRMVIMGGAINGPFEFNFFKDKAAARAALSAPCDKSLITGELCRQALFTPADLEALRRLDNPVSRYLDGPVSDWLRFNRLSRISGNAGGFYPWDVVAAVYLRRPEIFGDVEERRLRPKPGALGLGSLEDDPVAGAGTLSLPRTLLEPREVIEELLRSLAGYA